MLEMKYYQVSEQIEESFEKLYQGSDAVLATNAIINSLVEIIENARYNADITRHTWNALYVPTNIREAIEAHNKFAARVRKDLEKG
jgi:malate synthase